jgi:carboxymethylenebutenolidase
MITRRQVLQATGTFAGYALAVDTAFAQVIKQHNRDVEIVIYPGAGHALHADYRPSYNAEAAADGWKRCVGWFNKYLKA